MSMHKLGLRAYYLGAAAALACGSAAHAQATYTPQAITPNPDVYSYLAENPILDGIYGRQTTGQFSHLFVFGNSYADWGNCGASTIPCGNAINRYGSGLSMADGLEYEFGLQTSQVSNYAVGGALSGPTNALPDTYIGNSTGIESQIKSFIAGGGRISGSQIADITTFSGNDVFQLLGLSFSSAIAATLSAEQTDVSLLSGDGARTITITSGGDTGILPATGPGGLITAAGITPAEGAAFDATAFAGEQQFLTAYNRSPTRIFLFDLTTLEKRMIADPAAFGFTNVTQACESVASCANGSIAVQDSYMTYDGLHLSTLGFAWVAQYQANQVNAPSTIGAQSNLALATSRNFTGSILDRLDATASPGYTAQSGNSRVSLFLQGGTATGSLPDQQYAFGMAYDIPSIGLGVNYAASDDLDLGLEAEYAHPHAGLTQGEGALTLNSYLFAGYAKWHTPHWFGDFIINGGGSHYAITRTGVFNPLTASTSGGNFTLAARGGYNAGRLGGVLFSPVVGLDYTRIGIGGYSESGDVLLDQTVSAQTRHALLASAGLELHDQLTAGAANLDLFGKFLVDTTFGDNGHGVVTSQATTPGIEVLTVIPGAGNTVYEEASVGVTGALTPRLALQAAVGGMFGGQNTGTGFNASANVTYRF